MSQAPARFIVADINRALIAAEKSCKRGFPVQVAVDPDSTIRLVPVDKIVEVGTIKPPVVDEDEKPSPPVEVDTL